MEYLTMAYIIFLILYFSFFTSLAWHKPRWAVFLILAALPSYLIRFKIGPLPMTLLEGMILMLFFIWLVQKIKFIRSDNDTKFKVQNSKSKDLNSKLPSIISQFLNFLISHLFITLPIILFILAATISAIISSDKHAALGIWKAYFIEPILFLIVFIDTLHPIARRNIDKNSSQSAGLSSRAESGTSQKCWAEARACPKRKSNGDPFLLARIKPWVKKNSPGTSTNETNSSPPQQLPSLNEKITTKGPIKEFSFIASALAISALCIFIFAIYQKFTGAFVPQAFWQQGRITSIFPYPNAIGLYLAPIIIILFGALYKYVPLPLRERTGEGKSEPEPSSSMASLQPSTTDSKRLSTEKLNFQHIKSFSLNFIIIITIISSLAAIIFAKSEGALIALICGIFIFTFLYNKKSRLITSIIIILMLIAGAGIYFKYGKTWNELFSQTPLFSLDNICASSQTTVEAIRIKGDRHPVIPSSYPTSHWPLGCKIYQKLTLQDFSGTLRRHMWQETLAMLKTRPIMGAGLANYQSAMASYHKESYVEIYLYPHNVILNFWSETGLLGLVSFLWLIIIFFYLGLKSYYDSHDIFTFTLIIAMAVLLIHGLVDVPYFKNDLAILFWVIWGMMIIETTTEIPKIKNPSQIKEG